MTQALYRKWRPRKWEQVVAQEHVVQTLRNAIKNDRVGHAYLFSGPRGTGKTTTARLLAKAINCLSEDLVNRPCDECKNCVAVNNNRFMDLIEIDAASNTSVEDVRDLRDKINFSPSEGKFKVYIIDEVHMLSTAAFNALLKTLEEPPAHVIFILATTEVHKIPATVLSRCQRHEFRRIPVMDIVETLKLLCKDEQIKADEDALILIARQATGALRDAISLLDQLASTGETITLNLAQTVLGTATNQLVLDLINAIESNDMAAGLETIHRALDAGSDPRQYARQVVEYLRGLLLMRMGNEKQVEALKDGKNLMRQHSQLVEIPILMRWIEFFNNAINDLRTSWQPSLALEMAFAQAIECESDNLPAQLPSEKRASVQKSPPQKPKEVVETPVTEVDPPVESKPEKKQKVQKEPVQEVVSADESLSISTRDIQSAWKEIKAEVKLRRKNTEALLNTQRFVQVKDGTLILGFTTEILKSKMEAPDNLDATREAIMSVLNVDMPIKCILVSGKANTATPEMDVEADGIVGTALNLGGKLVHRE